MTEPVRGRKAAKLFLRDAMYHPDAVVEFPQSGERFDGVESVRQWRSEYPVPTAPVIEEVRGGGDIWVAQLRITYGDGPVNHGVGILEFRDNKIARETIYVAEGWDAPKWRTPRGPPRSVALAVRRGSRQLTRERSTSRAHALV